MIKTIFFDIGGVMLTNGWGHVSRENAAKKFGIDYAEMDYQHDFIFNVYEIGAITLDEYLDTVVFHKERNFSRDEFKEFMFQQSQELPEMISLLKNFKQQNPHLQIISLNNEGRELKLFVGEEIKTVSWVDNKLMVTLANDSIRLYKDTINFGDF